MKFKKITFCAVAILCCCGFSATMAQEEKFTPEQEEVVDFFKMTLTYEAFRKLAAESPEKAIEGFFTDRAKLRWENLTKDFSREQLRDFFLGALIFQGGFSADSAVTGYYNPWWDAILLTESSGLPAIPKISRFYFLAGEMFRKEKIADIPDYSGVFSLDNPLAINVSRLQQKTLAAFNKLYSSMEQTTLPAHKNSHSEENLKAIQFRSALRLQQVADLIGNRAHYDEAWLLAQMLQTGVKRDFKQIFTVDANQAIIQNFLAQDSTLRTGFVPYGYISSKNGRMYIFVNWEVPRLFATASLGGGWRKTIFEWYDLGRADQLLEIWNSRKEAAK